MTDWLEHPVPALCRTMTSATVVAGLTSWHVHLSGLPTHTTRTSSTVPTDATMRAAALFLTLLALSGAGERGLQRWPA